MFGVSLTSIRWDYRHHRPFNSKWTTTDPRTIKGLIRLARDMAEKEVKQAVSECPQNLGDTFHGSSGPIIRIYTGTRNMNNPDGPAFIYRSRDGWHLSVRNSEMDRPILQGE